MADRVSWCPVGTPCHLAIIIMLIIGGFSLSSKNMAINIMFIILILGGVSKSSKSLTSVEFYDSASGQWASLPNLQRGRRNHAMLVHNGRLTVTGGVQVRILTDWPDPLCPG